MKYYILDTLEQFNNCNTACYAAHMDSYDDQNGYTEKTLDWALPSQRLTDNKWICPVCPSYNNSAGYIIEESQPDWFPIDSP
jgi:rubrerythrin